MTWKVERKIAVKKKSVIYVVWAVWYVICLCLSLGKTPIGWAKAPFVLVGLLFYVPPFYLLFLDKKNKKTVKLLRGISTASLVVFAVLYALNILSVNWSVTTGRVLYYLLAVFSAPILCGQFFVLGLFLWASSLWTCILLLKKPDQNRPDQM